MNKPNNITMIMTIINRKLIIKEKINPHEER